MKKQSKTKRPSAPEGMKLTTDYLNSINGLISSADQHEALQRRFEMLMETSDEDDDSAKIKAAQLLRQIRPEEDDYVKQIIRMYVEMMAAERLNDDPEIQRLREEIDRLEKDKYGLEEDEYYPIDEMPDDLRELNDQWNRRMREIEAEILREHGEDALADLYLDDEAYKADLDERMNKLREHLNAKHPDDPTDFNEMPEKTLRDIKAEHFKSKKQK